MSVKLIDFVLPFLGRRHTRVLKSFLMLLEEFQKEKQANSKSL